MGLSIVFPRPKREEDGAVNVGVNNKQSIGQLMAR